MSVHSIQAELKTQDQPRRYLAGTAIILLVLMSLMGAFSYYVKWHSNFYQPHVFSALQHGKLDTPGYFDTVFVGDSSLGFGLYAPVFNQATGRHSVNVALNGQFGFAGSYSMARYALARHPEIRNIVVITASDAFTRPNSDRGYVLSATDTDLTQFDWPTRFSIAETFGRELLDAKVIRQLAKYVSGMPVTPLQDEYPRVSPKRPWIDPTGIQVSQIHFDGLYYLLKIRDLCRTKHAKCIFAFGPLLDTKFKNSRAYLLRADTMVRASGFVLADPNPIAVERKNLADVADHVTHEYKHTTTLHYAKILGPLLR